MTKTFQIGQRVQYTERQVSMLNAAPFKKKDRKDWSSMRGTVAKVEGEGYLVTVEWDGHGAQGLNPSVIRLA